MCQQFVALKAAIKPSTSTPYVLNTERLMKRELQTEHDLHLHPEHLEAPEVP